MLFEQLSQLPEYAKDVRLNVKSLLQAETGLTPVQQAGTALASAYATNHEPTIEAISDWAKDTLSDADIQAAKIAASLMAMNNVYYRYTHSVSDKKFQSMPAGLRMNMMNNAGVDKTDFELYSLAVSAINNCTLCMDSHTSILLKTGLTHEAIQHSIKIAAAVHSLAQALLIQQH